MDSKNNINFLPNTSKNKIKLDKKTLAKFLYYPIIFAISFIIVFTASLSITGDSISESIQKIAFLPFQTLTISGDKPLLSGAERINFLILGMAGAGYDGPYLTDTIIFASLNTKTNEIGMMSIPRDLSVPIPGNGWQKINYLNHYGEMREVGSGAEFAAKAIGELINQPIDYYIRVDFSGFQKLIDELDGLDIYVDNSFTDNEFPGPNNSYQTVSFEKGWQHMNGFNALSYARSRHGNNGEASDFARSARQQKVLIALKEKALSYDTFFNLRKIGALYDMYSNHVATNLTNTELIQLVKMAKKFKTENINNIVLDNSPSGVLYSAFINGAYVLLPKDDSFFEIKNLAENVFTKQEVVKYNPIVIEILNGTKIEGLAYKTMVRLEAKGYRVAKFGNAPKQDYDKTVIYDYSNGAKNDELNKLKDFLKTNIILNSTSEISNNSSADFIIILGKDQDLETVSKL